MNSETEVEMVTEEDLKAHREHLMICDEDKGQEDENIADSTTEVGIVIGDDSRDDRSVPSLSPLGIIIRVRRSCDRYFKKNKHRVNQAIKVILLLGYLAYFVYAMIYRFGDEGSVRLMVGTVLVILGYVVRIVFVKIGPPVSSSLQSTKCVIKITRHIQRRYVFLQRMVSMIAVLAIFIYILVEVFIEFPSNVISAVGLVVFIMIMFFFSKDPAKVVWRPVLWGLLLQFIFALVVLRSTWGYGAFDWLAQRITEYLKHSDIGANFVFGPALDQHLFAFTVLPVIVFFSATISVLYYLGWIQVLIRGIAVVMEHSLGISAMESLHAAFNIFVGWAETTTFLRPFFDDMTLPELHTVMTNGFATVSGSTLVVYHMYGAPANHLLSASVMSAPAALALSKLFYPDDKVRRSKVTLDKKGHGQNIIDAASIGAIGAVSIVAYILVSVLAFFSLLGFCNATLEWLGDRVGLTPPDYPVLSFQLICSYLFWPLVFLMGVEPADCHVAARMVGIKTFINEFFAYEDLGEVIRNGQKFRNFNGTWHLDTTGNIVMDTPGNATILIGGVMSARSEVITTYALCGFSNMTALGIMIGALTAVAPSRKEDIVRVSFRALISGCMACFITACVAGLLTTAQ
ncbi:solute carrier family 28 member 3-like [Mizuhopecten yessoensis]|uniref:Solute carrier family 28 member 3 n=1 Tax=Mizuhopecten yessoensis TaxID=6573 RepID=A0A210Q6X6_MIZYE|nr:solute carrier family 28 member 3-like [Mizuhopecten yessoensis]OWF44492.1 Solute carrier family 28 member 3 [Mizuhopecten yessoensis]